MLSFFLIFGVLLAGLNMSILDPVSDAFNDVDFTDINFSYLGKNDDLRGVDNETGEMKLDTNIIIINIGDLKRPGLANLINTISNYSPKVIGVDILFDREKDSLADNALSNAIQKAGNVILVSKGVDKYENKNEFDSIIQPIPILAEHCQFGIANMAIEDTGNDLDKFKICREFVAGSFLKNGEYNPCFDTKITRLYNPTQAKKHSDRQKFEEIINYSGNLFIEFSNRLTFPRFKAKDYTEVFAQDFTNPTELKKAFQNKIVLLGYLGDQIDAINDDDDKFFTPLNKKYIGKASLDMYGVVIHANIISMILNERHITKTPIWLSQVIGILITYLTFAAFRPIYNDYKIWYDGGTKVMSFIIVLIIMFLIGYIFSELDYKLTFPGIYMGAILLAGDYMEIYYGLFVNIAHKFRKKQ
jgi:CHASE2 domain-containing sensor protein